MPEPTKEQMERAREVTYTSVLGYVPTDQIISAIARALAEAEERGRRECEKGLDESSKDAEQAVRVGVAWMERAKAAEAERDRLREELEAARKALEKVGALITTADVRMDKGPRYRFITTGQHEAALAIRAALAARPGKEGE